MRKTYPGPLPYKLKATVQNVRVKYVNVKYRQITAES